MNISIVKYLKIKITSFVEKSWNLIYLCKSFLIWIWKFIPVSICTKLASFKFQSSCEMSDSICGEKGICIPNYQDGSVRCKCKDGYIGPTCGKCWSCHVHSLAFKIWDLWRITLPDHLLSFRRIVVASEDQHWKEAKDTSIEHTF